VKTGSGAFLRDPAQARFLATLMVETGERSGTRTAALLTDMSQPLGSSAGNWIEIAECCELLRGERPALSDDLRTVSLELAAWMLFLGGAEASVEAGRARAEALLASGAAWACFRAIVAAQGGDVGVLDRSREQHKPGAQRLLRAAHDGFLSRIDTTAMGWAVQRLGAGRVRAGEPIDPHAGLVMHVKLGDAVKAGEPLCTLFAASEARFAEPAALLDRAILISEGREEPPAWIGEVITQALS
jgi:pyrimidine-nucleoside phosphorylase